MLCDKNDRIHFFFLMIRRPPRSTLFPLHDALPICFGERLIRAVDVGCGIEERVAQRAERDVRPLGHRSEEHTSELQSRQYLVCRLLLEKKKHTPSEHLPYRQ